MQNRTPTGGLQQRQSGLREEEARDQRHPARPEQGFRSDHDHVHQGGLQE